MSRGRHPVYGYDEGRKSHSVKITTLFLIPGRQRNRKDTRIITIATFLYKYRRSLAVSQDFLLVVRTLFCLSGSNIAGVERARQLLIGGAFNDGACIRKNGHIIVINLETQDILIIVDFSHRFKPCCQLLEI